MYSPLGHFMTLIREGRKKNHDMSQLELAENLGLAQSYVAQMEGGLRVPNDKKILNKIAKCLKLDPEELYDVAERAYSELREKHPLKPFDPDFLLTIWERVLSLMNNRSFSESDRSFLWKHYWGTLRDDDLLQLVSRGPLRFLDLSTFLVNVLALLMRNQKKIQESDIDMAIGHYASQNPPDKHLETMLRKALAKQLIRKDSKS